MRRQPGTVPRRFLSVPDILCRDLSNMHSHWSPDDGQAQCSVTLRDFLLAHKTAKPLAGA